MMQFDVAKISMIRIDVTAVFAFVTAVPRIQSLSCHCSRWLPLMIAMISGVLNTSVSCLSSYVGLGKCLQQVVTLDFSAMRCGNVIFLHLNFRWQLVGNLTALGRTMFQNFKE